MTAPQPTPIDALLWTATRYSDVLGIDRRKTAQVLEKLPSTSKSPKKRPPTTWCIAP